MRPPNPIILAGLVVALVAGACGSEGNGHNAHSDGDVNGTGAARTVEIEMQDIAYSPDQIRVESGETVRLLFTNVGEITHDAFIGDAGAQEDHEQEMTDHGGHEAGDGAISVEPGDTGELTHTFDANDDVLIGCHEPGHYDAGMRLTIEVN